MKITKQSINCEYHHNGDQCWNWFVEIEFKSSGSSGITVCSTKGSEKSFDDAMTKTVFWIKRLNGEK